MPQPKEETVERFKYLNYFPLPYVGVSILNAFLSCPVSFYFRYYKDVVFPPNDKMKFGIVFQDALTASYKGEDFSMIIDGLDSDKDKEKAKDLLGKAKEFKDILYYDEYMFVDLGIGIPVRFAADLITKNEIVENKTTSGYYNREMAKSQHQGSLYHECIKTMFGLDLPVKYQIFNIPKTTCELVILEKTQKDSDEVISWMVETLGKIEKCYTSGNWITAYHGKYPCNLKRACPIVNRNMVEIGV